MFYVYDLIDPRDGKTFYVGKGSGDRKSEHVREARKGITGPKCDRIREIETAGLKVSEQIVREFDDEASAYAYERRRIAKLGRDSLTNIAPGGGGIRVQDLTDAPKVSREQVVALFSRIAAKPEPTHGLWAAAIHRAVIRALPRLIENRA
jgi:hypothetical protein